MKTNHEQIKIDLEKLINLIGVQQQTLTSNKISANTKIELYEKILEDIKYELTRINK